MEKRSTGEWIAITIAVLAGLVLFVLGTIFSNVSQLTQNPSDDDEISEDVELESEEDDDAAMDKVEDLGESEVLGVEVEEEIVVE